MGARILIVEDHERSVWLEKAVLESAGFSVSGEDSGRAGLEQVRASKPDAVIIDIRLPDMSGIELANSIRSFSKVPIIFVTAVAAAAQMEDIMMIPGCAVIQKPINTRTFAREVEKHISACGGR